MQDIIPIVKIDKNNRYPRIEYYIELSEWMANSHPEIDHYRVFADKILMEFLNTKKWGKKYLLRDINQFKELLIKNNL